MKQKLLALSLLVLLVPFFPAAAAQFIKPDGSGNTTISDSGKRNVYTAGGNVTVTANIGGDLIAAGGNVLVQGQVEQDLIAGGGTIIVNGSIGSDVRIGGGNVTITGKVAGDVLVGGGNVTIARTAEIGGDLIAGAGNIVIDGPVAGNARIGGGTIQINNRIGGEVRVVSDQSLAFGAQSVVAGKIIHRGPSEASIADGAQVSTIDFQMKARKHKNFGAPISVAGLIICSLSMLAAGLLLLKFLPKSVSEVIEKAQDKPWHNLGLGLLFAIALPIAAIISIVTLIGVYPGLIMIAWLIAVSLLVSILESIFLGVLLLKWLKKYDGLNWKAAAAGVVGIAILSFIPILGALACFMLWLMTFGAVLRQFKTRLTAEQTGLGARVDGQVL